MKKEKSLVGEITDLKEIKGIQKDVVGFFDDVVKFWTENVKTDSYWHKDLSKRMDMAINGMKKEEKNFVSMVKTRQNGEWPEHDMEHAHNFWHIVLNDILQESKTAGFKVSENEHFLEMFKVYEEKYYKWRGEIKDFDIPAYKDSYYSYNYCCSIEYGATQEWDVLHPLLFKCLEAPYQLNFYQATPAQKRMGIFPDEYFPEYTGLDSFLQQNETTKQEVVENAVKEIEGCKTKILENTIQQNQENLK